MKRVALKYCGGCDPAYDRVEYYEKIKAKANGLIEWVTLEAPHFEAILLINGCERACAEKYLNPGFKGKVLSIINNALSPEEAVKILLR